MEHNRGDIVRVLREMGIESFPRSWGEESPEEAALPGITLQTREERERNFENRELAMKSNAVEIVQEKESGVEVYANYSLSDLEADAKKCVKCRLCETRNSVVFGVGNTKSPLIAFVGEGPGADEDMKGEPFVGRAGQLLTAAITKGLGLRREDVYICNVVKCRPPENRAPLPDETEACTPYLYRQLELVKPRVIITLGQPAQMSLSGVKLGITKLRGQWQEWRGIKLMPTFHPAYLLRNPPAKKPFWEDLQTVMKELGLPIQKGF